LPLPLGPDQRLRESQKHQSFNFEGHRTAFSCDRIASGDMLGRQEKAPPKRG
jgi:hypothetical protein